MHRVLSYQTAVRANNERDVREYVTKRTCVSLILSIAFFTLISGFLLGKFVSDRQHQIKDLSESEIEYFRQLHYTHEDLLGEAQTILNKYPPAESAKLEDEMKLEISTRFKACMQHLPTDYDGSLDLYISDIYMSSNRHQLHCLKGLKTFVSYVKPKDTNN